jgi:hypothetical protein
MVAAPRAIPVNPNAPATNEITRNISAHFSIHGSRFGQGSKRRQKLPVPPLAGGILPATGIETYARKPRRTEFCAARATPGMPPFVAFSTEVYIIGA